MYEWFILNVWFLFIIIHTDTKIPQAFQNVSLIKVQESWRARPGVGGSGSIKTPRPAFTNTPDSKVYGANMGPIWGRQDPGGPHVGPMNFAIWDCVLCMNALLHLHTSMGCKYSPNSGILVNVRKSIFYCSLRNYTPLKTKHDYLSLTYFHVKHFCQKRAFMR